MIPENLRDLVQKLNDIDKEMPNPPTREALAAYNGKRVAVLEQIVASVDPAQQDVWLKQLADSLSGGGRWREAGRPAHHPAEAAQGVARQGPEPGARRLRRVPPPPGREQHRPGA